MARDVFAAVNKAKEHYRAKRGAMEKYRCDAWDMDIYYPTVLTMDQRSKISEAVKEGGLAMSMVEIVCQLACDADGERMFPDAVRPDLAKLCDADVVAEIAQAIFSERYSVTPEEAEGN